MNYNLNEFMNWEFLKKKPLWAKLLGTKKLAINIYDLAKHKLTCIEVCS